MVHSPWGALPVDDAHIHFFSHRFLTLLAQQKGVSFDEAATLLTPWVMPPPDPAELARTWAAELDRQGVGQAVLIASLPADVESVAAALRAVPGRFHGFFLYDPRPGAAAAEVALGQGLRGMCLFPAMHRYSLHDAGVREIFALAAAHPHTAVFVHCGLLSVGVRKRLGLPSVFDARLANPLDVEQYAHAYPQVPVIIPHFGAGYLREALMLAVQCPNVYLDTSSSNSWMKIEGLDLRHLFQRALDVVGAKRLLFGTDSSYFPRGWNAAVFDTQAKALYELGVSEEDARLIFGGNLRRLLGA
jgi:predicted TIM-barrel fold metal-dependent hydrolase